MAFPMDEESCQKAFEAKIKTKSFETFSLFMFDQKTNEAQQRQLLGSILFDDHKSPKVWAAYIQYVSEKFKDKKSHLQRLINKALELLDEKALANDRDFLSIHLCSINLKGTNDEKNKYFQNILYKRNIGVTYSELYKLWAEVAEDPTAVLALAPTVKVDTLPTASSTKVDPVPSSSTSAPMEDDDISENPTLKVATIDIKERMKRIKASEKPAEPESAMKRKRVSFNKTQNITNHNNFSTHAVKESQPEEKKTSHTSSSSSLSSSSSSSKSKNIFLQKDRYSSVNGFDFIELSQIGKGGSSSVFKVASITDGNIYALKKIDLSKHLHNSDEDEVDEVFQSYTNEIELLTKLKNTSPYIIDLVSHQIFKTEKKIIMLLELADIDLAKLLNQQMKKSAELLNTTNASHPAGLDPFFIRMIWKEMLLAVNHIHENRIVHGDLKPANFVFVKGHLKLIDFGIAKSISVDTTNIYRDTQIGTVNYMAPEAISPMTDDTDGSNKSTMKIGRASDIWSLGCILYQMIYGKPPFAHLNTLQKLSVIPNANYEIAYPEHFDLAAIDTMKSCLIRNPKQRATIMGENGLFSRDFLKVNSSNPSSSSNNIINNTVIPSFESMSTSNANTTQQQQQHQDDVSSSSSSAGSSNSTAVLPEKKIEEIKFQILDMKAEVVVTQPTAQAPSVVQKSILSQSSQLENKENVPFVSVSSSSSSAAVNPHFSVSFPVKRRLGSPKKGLKAIPNSLKEEIVVQNKGLVAIQSEEGVAKASKWQKLAIPEQSDMKSILEKRMIQMRKFLDVDQDNHTATESIDLSGFYKNT